MFDLRRICISITASHVILDLQDRDGTPTGETLTLKLPTKSMGPISFQIEAGAPEYEESGLSVRVFADPRRTPTYDGVSHVMGIGVIPQDMQSASLASWSSPGNITQDLGRVAEKYGAEIVGEGVRHLLPCFTANDKD